MTNRTKPAISGAPISAAVTTEPRTFSQAHVDALLAAQWHREQRRVARYLLGVIDGIALQLLAGEPRARVAAVYRDLGHVLLQTAAEAVHGAEPPARRAP